MSISRQHKIASACLLVLAFQVPLASITAASSQNRTVSTPPVAFIKEISTDGNINTMDYLFHVWPMFICLNPAYIKFLLEPVLSYLATDGWPHPYVVHDLGHRELIKLARGRTSLMPRMIDYPNATGHNDGLAESMPNFETASLFILLQAYLKFTGDAGFAQRYMSLLKGNIHHISFVRSKSLMKSLGYAEWLADHSLHPASQLMNVDFIRPTANQTLLSIMSTIALKAAYHVTSNITYSRIADSNVEAIYNSGLGLDAARTHFTYNHGVDETWGVLYPAFADVALNLGTFPSRAWDMQSTWYSKQMTQFGLPFGRTKGASLEWGSTDISESMPASRNQGHLNSSC